MCAYKHSVYFLLQEIDLYYDDKNYTKSAGHPEMPYLSQNQNEQFYISDKILAGSQFFMY